VADLLIRDLPDEVIVRIDQKAERLGISRAEYLRRHLTGVSIESAGRVTRQSLETFGEAFGDLADPEVMDQAWR
jgi:hypothetical protein